MRYFYYFVWCFVTMVFISCSVMVSDFVLMFVVYLVLLNGVCFLSLGVHFIGL